jgi:ABC-type transport system involved in multi-copper enzyme maturation permease subunit
VAISGAYVAWALTYGAAYTAVFLILAALAFQNKDV